MNSTFNKPTTGQDAKSDSRAVLEFIDSIKYNKKAFDMFMTTMHREKLVSRNTLSVLSQRT